MDKEKFYATMGARSQSASSKRNLQLKNWDKSETNKQSDTINPKRLQPRVQFGDNVVFLAAAQSGDVEEVERLLQEGADVNAVNSDGLTGLHQCCIDDDFQMVQTLVKHGANVDAQDNEGWSPLHAAASCDHEHIVRFLLESNAHPALVNNEGDTPLDLAEDYEEIAELISSHIDANSVDVDAAKNLEEAQMLADANRLKNDPTLVAPISPGGATLLHIAAAKGYLSVMQVLLSMKVEIDALDDDGWTPLHAAVYWRNMEAAELLVSHGADITRTTKIGDTIEDLVDPELADNLESLKKLEEEHNNRHRRYAVSARSSRPSLTHSNSKDDMKSPNLLRRRSSKERSIAVHKLDKEREKFPDYPSTNSISTSIMSTTELNDKKTADVSTVPTINHNTNEGKSSEDMELVQESKNIAKEEALQNEDQSIEPSNHSPVLSSSDNSPTGSPSTTPRSVVIGKIAPGTKSSPKIAGKKGMSPNMMKRVGLWESQSTPGPLASSTPSTDKIEVKKYAFQARTISDISTRSNSLDATVTKTPSGVAGRRTTFDHTTKRASYDERKLKEGLSPPTTDYKTSSLPRGATVSPIVTPVISTSLPRGSKINTPDKSKDRLSVTDELLESKNKDSVDGTVSSSGDPTPGAETKDQQSGARSAVEEVSEGDSTLSNRSASESETKRKQHARRSRQQRQPTQPVDNEILQKLLQRDKLKEEQESAESSPEVKPKNSMSAYKPSSRPMARTANSSQPPALPWSVEQESSPDSSPPVKPKQLELDESPSTASEAGEDKSTGIQHPRSKSTARRRPKKERRSTGLPFEAEEGEHIPEELANIIVRKPSDDSSVVDSSGLTASGEEELRQLRQELEEERKWRENLARDKNEMSRELEALKNKVSELTRRHSDATRAYEQEKKERELQETRVLELENGSKNLQDLKKECQRLKDENSALIRVIGKLSRSPLPSSTV